MGAFEDNLGKISVEIFKEDLLNRSGASRSEVLQGPAFGVDTSVIDLGNERVLVVSSDPLSLIPSLGMEVSAWLSVHLLANDLCTSGFPPQYVQFVLNLSPSLSRQDFNVYWHYIHDICKSKNIAITGGHTGQIFGQESTIAGGGTMFLVAPKSKVLSSNGAKSGDKIVMTKSAALSSTSLLARAFPQTVEKRLGKTTQNKAAENFWKISVLEESKVASSALNPNVDLRAMHDVTEGGILGAVNEMAQASGVGFTVNADFIPVEREVKAIADLFDIDPYFSIGAGSMIIAVSPESEDTLLSALNTSGIGAATIGEFGESNQKTIIKKGEAMEFLFDGVDPYWAAFYKALSKNWK